ncbi:MAG: Holliday junction resolvase RuvX [Bryobacteraceae bacterium]
MRTTGRLLALDLGKRRIGLAVSDELGITAQGLETLQRTRVRDDIDYLVRLIAELNVTEIVMGNPLHMSGHEGRQVKYTQEFAERIGERSGVAVTYWDERLTTVAAQRVLRESGISIEKRAKAVDRLSAVILLESYLDSEKRLNAAAANFADFRADCCRRCCRRLFSAETLRRVQQGSIGRDSERYFHPKHCAKIGDAKVIESEWPFLLARGLTRNANLQAGEYKFDRPLSVFDVYFKISRGEVYYRELTIPEGNNMFDIAHAVEAQGLMKAEAFLKVARNPAMIRDLAPDAPSLEGFLFPSKYRLTRTTKATELRDD